MLHTHVIIVYSKVHNIWSHDGVKIIYNTGIEHTLRTFVMLTINKYKV